MKKKSNNIIKFPSSISKIERKVEAILFAASEPLDLETIEKRLQNVTNIKKMYIYVLEGRLKKKKTSSPIAVEAS